MGSKRKPKVVLGWHFSRGHLGYGDGRPVEAGAVHTVDGKPVLCDWGLHASQRAIDALSYRRGHIVARVELYNPVVGDDKMVASKRRYLWVADATEVLREFARWAALQVVDLWDCPEVVRRYLETGDESLRSEARASANAAANAAYYAATDAAAYAAYAYAYATDAAYAYAATSAAAAAAYAAAAAAAAYAADRAAMREQQNTKLTKLLEGLAPLEGKTNDG